MVAGTCLAPVARRYVNASPGTREVSGMMLPTRISGGRARPAVALLLVGCLVSFTLGQQFGYAWRYPELHASTIPTAHAAGQLSGRLSAPSSRLSVAGGPGSPRGQQAPPVVTTPSHAHTAARAPATKPSAARHGKKDMQGKKGEHDGEAKQYERHGNPAARRLVREKHQKGGGGHGCAQPFHSLAVLTRR